MHIRTEVLSAYLDGEATPRERAQVDAALAHDPEVARRLNKLRAVDALLLEALETAFARPMR